MALFRYENPVLGPDAQVEIPNGASAPTLAKPVPGEFVTIHYQAAPTTAKQDCVFIAPAAPSLTAPIRAALGSKWQVVGVSAVWGTASTSGTIDVLKAATGTADNAGTTLLQGTIDGSTTAATPNSGSLVTNQTTLQLGVNDRILVAWGGNCANWVDVTVQVYVVRIA